MNIGKKINNLRYKTLIYLISFSVILLLFLWVSQTVLTNFLYEKYQISDMNDIAKEISNVDVGKLNPLLVDIVYKNAVCIEYVDNFGRSTLYNDASEGCLLGKNSSNINSYKKEMFNSNEDLKKMKLVNPDYNLDALLYGVRVDSGYVFIFSMLSNVNRNSMAIKNQFIYIIGVVFIFAIVVSFFISEKLSLPIMNITKKSKLVASGNYDVEFVKNGITEIDELVDSLNYMEKEISKTDQYRRDLMANVSHDLKTPLTMIKAYAEMIRDITYKDKNKMKDNLNVIIEETDRLNLLVNDILVLSKLQAQTENLEIEEFDLVLEIESILKRYDILVETEGYNFKKNLPDKVIVKADKNKINQVIYNLINNAINYTGDDKVVTINVKDNKKDYLVEIVDSGKGISKKEISNIWDKYYKNEKNHKRNRIGTGLGLSIVKNILEKHDFVYGVKSIKDKGTTFYFKIKK